MTAFEHEVSALAPGVWCISEFGLVNAFLVEGTEKAALIDTGNGLGNIRAVAERLTQRPLVVALTHGHPDHDGGAYLFAHDCPIYLNRADEPLLTHEVLAPTNAFREAYVRSRTPVRFPGPGHVEALLALVPRPEPPVAFPWTHIGQGDAIDLGGVELEVMETPGHSPGSVCYLDASHRILFSGDTVNRNIILARQPDDGLSLVRSYDATLKKIWEHEGRFDALAIGHDGTTVEKGLVTDYLWLTKRLLDGSLVGAYEEVGIRKGDVVRHGGAELWYRCDA